MLNPNKTVLIERFPDKDVPEAYLRKVLKDFSSCGGYAVQTIEQGAPLLVSDRMDTGAELEAVQALLKGYASSRILLTFSKLEKVEEGSLQPFDFLMPGDVTPLMCFGIEGEFPTLVEAGTIQEVNFAKKVIIPNFNKFLKLSEGDLAKFIAEIKDPTFVDSLMARIGERGVFCFLPPTGDAIWLGKNKFGSTYPWGQVSLSLDYVEQPVTPAVAEAKKGGWWNVGPKAPVAQESPPPSPATKPPPLGLPEQKPDTKIDAPPATPTPQDTTAPPAGHWEELPKGLSNKDKKAFVRRVTGCGNNLPDGYDQPGWKYWVVDYPAKAKTLEALKNKLEQEGPKDMRSSIPPKIVTPDVVGEVNSMVLSADEATEAETTIVKILDRQGKEIPNPLEIQKMEQKYPTFTKRFGVTSEQIDTWLPADVEAFAKAHGKAFFHLFLETRREKIESKSALAMLSGKHVYTDAPADKAEPQPEKKAVGGGWSNWGK